MTDYAAACVALLDEIALELKATAYSTGVAVLSAPVRQALRDVPRQDFVSAALRASAYGNYPLSIGRNQTISQPYIVALMTELLACGPRARVLEVGTGSGYQAAVLSRLVAKVYSLEIIAELSEQARQRFVQLGYDNIEAKTGDGYHGWPEQAPFDAIIVTAAAPYVPPALIEQLRPGGRLVIPVGEGFFSAQDLLVIEKDANGEIHQRSVLPVAFVPLTGQCEHGREH